MLEKMLIEILKNEQVQAILARYSVADLVNAILESQEQRPKGAALEKQILQAMQEGQRLEPKPFDPSIFVGMDQNTFDKWTKTPMGNTIPFPGVKQPILIEAVGKEGMRANDLLSRLHLELSPEQAIQVIKKGCLFVDGLGWDEEEGMIACGYHAIKLLKKDGETEQMVFIYS